MSYKITIRGERKPGFGVGLIVLALIELARQLQEQEEQVVRAGRMEVTSATGTEEVADD